MPASELTYTTSSSASRRARNRHYYKVASTSQVDESLFGNKNDMEHHCSQIEREARERSAQRRKGKSPIHEKETVRLVTKDLVRNLIVPQEEPTGEALILTQYDLDRLRNAARILTEEEKRELEERRRMEKEEALNQVHTRKNYIKEQDMYRRKNEKLNDLEEEERIKSEQLRQKANEQLEEQEDEIKHLNELIMSAKCHAIRDAQILEKDIIKKELAEEEMRLDQAMEIDRVNALQIEDEIEKKRREERLLGAMQIMEQMKGSEQNKLLELEMKDQENMMMQRYLDQLCEEEAEKLQKKRTEQIKLRDELNKCNADIARHKEISKEQEKMLEEKVIQFQKDKAEREAAFEKEQERMKIEKEKEVARLRGLQERARDEQAERDALRAKRAQEKLEREWRQREAEEARKKALTEEMLRNARAQQMEQKQHFLAVQAQRERADFERVLRTQQELIEKEKRGETEQQKKKSKFAEDIRLQIRDREAERIEERQRFFEEGARLDEEARLRRLKIEEVKRRKLDELRDAGIHEKYLSQIERKVNQSQHISA